jgi:hypothetical protein
MTALRYSGDASVRVTYLDTPDGLPDNRNGGYRCFVRTDSGERFSCVVGAPQVLQHAVDAPEAFDDAAKAALAFAEHEGISLQCEYDEQLSDRLVHRSRRKP